MPVERSTSGLLLEVSLVDVPRGQQMSALTAHLRSAVRRGLLPAGTRLPASRTLASDLGVSRGVVVRAYEQLTAEGYLDARQGSGTTVAAVPRRPEPVASPPPRPASNPGLPPGALFPREAWGRAATRAMAGLADADLGYGDPAGHPRLRAELAAYLGRVRAVVAPPDRTLVVNGFAQGCRLLADVLRSRGLVRVGLEDPGSVGLRDQLTGAGVTCVPVPVDEEGVRVDALERADVRTVVVTPAHQFPTGVVTSPERRHALLAWARATDSIIVEDDYDAEYRYDRTPVGSMQGLGPDVVIHGGSISKTLAPGLRLGWLVLPEDLVAPFRDAKYATDLATSVLEQLTLAEFLAAGDMDRHIRRTATVYRRRRDRLVTELARCLPDWEVTGTAAGLHLVVLLPPGAEEATVVAAARAAGLDARPLGSYAVRRTERPGLVVGYGHRHPDALARSVRALARDRRTARPEA